MSTVKVDLPLPDVIKLTKKAFAQLMFPHQTTPPPDNLVRMIALMWMATMKYKSDSNTSGNKVVPSRWVAFVCFVFVLANDAREGKRLDTNILEEELKWEPFHDFVSIKGLKDKLGLRQHGNFTNFRRNAKDIFQMLLPIENRPWTIGDPHADIDSSPEPDSDSSDGQWDDVGNGCMAGGGVVPDDDNEEDMIFG